MSHLCGRAWVCDLPLVDMRCGWMLALDRRQPWRFRSSWTSLSEGRRIVVFVVVCSFDWHLSCRAWSLQSMHPSTHNCVLLYIHDMGADCWRTRFCRRVVATHQTACDSDGGDRALPPSLLQPSVLPCLVIFLPALCKSHLHIIIGFPRPAPARRMLSSTSATSSTSPLHQHLLPGSRRPLGLRTCVPPIGLLQSVQAAKILNNPSVRSPPSSQVSSPLSIFVVATTS
eukprot:COSAG01_NODE_4591_length_4892_cov_69.289589_7_plen_228_part_00